MSKLITAEMLKEYARWDAPTVASSGAQTSTRNVMSNTQLEKIKKQAYEEAYKQGLREGLAAGQGQIQTKVKQLDSVLRTLAKPLAELDDQVEHELTSLALAIARHVVRREISADPGQIIAVMRQALASLPLGARQVRLHLHPEDAGLVRSTLSMSNEQPEYQIVEDPAIQRGGCRVVTNISHIDATIENRFAAIAANVLGGERVYDKPAD